MLNTCQLLLLALAATACSNLPCDTKSLRKVDWDEAPPGVGFSADDFEADFAAKWRAEVLSAQLPEGYPPSLQAMDQEWIWSWRPDRSETVLHRERKQRDVNYCNIIRWEFGSPTLIIPVHVEGWSTDGTWAFAGRSELVTWALPTANNPLLIYWSTRFGSRPAESVMLTRTPHTFEEEAADFLGLPQLPAVALVGTGMMLDGFKFGLRAVDPHLGNASHLPNSALIGASPQMRLAEAIP